MADTLHHFEVTEPAGSTPTNNSTYAVPIPQGVVTEIIVHLPAGHAGQTGIQIAYGTHQVIPEPPETYYRGNKRTRVFPLSELWPTGGTWFVIVYNQGRYPHTFEVDFYGDAVALDAANALPPVVLLTYANEQVAASPGAPAPAPVPGGGGIVPA